MREPLGHRFFFALLPPLVLARAVAQAASWFDAAGRPLPPERLHVTLFVLPDFTAYLRAIVDALREVGDRLAAGPVDLALDRAVGSRSSIALRPSRRIEALADLHRQLGGIAQAVGVAERAGYSFAPHLTLGYREGAPFQQRIAPVAWRAEEVVLIHSLLGRTRHEVLGRWPLTGGGQLTLF